MRSLLVTVMLCSLAPVLAQDEPLLRNGSFEEVREGATPTVAVGCRDGSVHALTLR